MMATTLSPAAFAISALSSSPLKAKRHNNSASFYSQTPFRYNPLSARPSIPRKASWVRATVLQDQEEKVVVEESFPAKTSADDGGKGGGNEPPESSSLESWVIKLEQSVNIFLTDSVIKELGGNAWWVDRFLAQHIAFVYYFMIVFMYALSPRMAYHFSECVEIHAYETYDKFIKAQGEELKTSPAPEVAVKYYTGGDLYMFDEFQTSRVPNTRRPKIENLYDVFLNIRDDEAEHCKTMKACQTHGNLRSPHSYAEDASEDDSACVPPQTDCQGIVDCIKKSVTSPPVKQDI